MDWYKAYFTLILGISLIYQINGLYRMNCECGLTGSSDRIVGGWDARAHEYPWIVPIYNQNKLFCGGAIINSRYILTAGHCVRWTNAEDLTIQVGAHDRRKVDPANMFSTESVILHPNFFSHKMYDENDIALIKVDRPIPFSNTVHPVCLPDKDSNFDDEYATVAGWGNMGEGRKVAAILQETIVKVLSQAECSKTKMKSVLNPTVLCAFKTKADSCQGDSGGPLVYEREPGKLEQIGIVSWGIGCGLQTPGIYTRVTEYLDWIYQNTSDGVFCQQ